MVSFLCKLLSLFSTFFVLGFLFFSLGSLLLDFAELCELILDFDEESREERRLLIALEL